MTGSKLAIHLIFIYRDKEALENLEKHEIISDNAEESDQAWSLGEKLSDTFVFGCHPSSGDHDESKPLTFYHEEQVMI